MARTIGVQFSVGASVQRTVASAFGTVASRVKGLKSDLRDLEKESKATNRLTAAMDKRTQIKAQYRANPTEELRAALRTANTEFGRAAAQARTYGVTVQNAAEAQSLLSSRIERTRGALVRQQQLQANQAKRSELQGQMLGTVASVMTVAAPIKVAIDFESNMADAAKTIDGMRDSAGNLTPKFYGMQTAVKELGRTLPLTHSELAKLFAAGGQLGMTGTDELKEFTTMSAHMSVAFGMNTEAAADAIGGYRTALGMSVPEVRSMLDLMNQYANTSSASEKGIAETVKIIGQLGGIGGVAAKPMTALAATLDSMKIPSEVAATGIKNMLLAMTSGDSATKGQTAAFAKLGIDTKKLAETMQKDGPAAILSVMEAIKRLPKAEQLSIMKKIFGSESLTAIAPMLNNLELLKKNLVIATDETAYAGAMQEEFENRSRTTANALVIAKNRLSELGITLGSVVLPAMVKTLETVGPYISAAARFAETHQTATAVVFTVVAALVTLKVATLAGGYAATMISDAWTMASGVAEKLRWTSITSTAALVRQRAVMMYTATATRLAAAGQWLLNAAMTANPIGLIVVAVAALAAGFAVLYNKSETFRKVVSVGMSAVVTVFRTAAAVLLTPFVMAWDGIQAIWGSVGPWFSQQWASVSSMGSAAWTLVTGYASAAWSSVVGTWGMVSAFFNENLGAVSAVCGTVWNGISSTICGVWDSVRAKATELFDWLASKFEWLSTATNMVSTGWAKAKSLVGLGEEEASPAATAAPQTGTEPPTARAWYEFWKSDVNEEATAVQPMQTASGPAETAAVSQPGAVIPPMTTAPVEPEPPSPGASASRTGATSPEKQPSAARGSATGGVPAGTVAPGAAVSLTQEITLNGITDADFARRVVDAVKARKGDFERLLSSIVDDQKRLAYGR